MGSHRGTAKAATVFLLAAGAQRGVALLIIPFLTHVMAPSEYGAATMLTATSFLLVSILAGPLESLVVYTAPRGTDETPGLLRVAGLYCYVLVPIVASLIAIGFALLVPEFLRVNGTYWAIGILAIGLQPAMSCFALPVLRSTHELRKFAWLAACSVLFYGASKVLFLIVLRWGILGWVVSDLVTAFLCFALAVVLVRPPRAPFRLSHAREVARFAIPLIPHHASSWAIASLSRPALATVSTLTQVGIFSFGVNIASVANVAVSEVNRAAQPRYSRETFPAPTAETFTTVRWQLVLALAIPASAGAVLAFAGQWLFAEPYWSSFPLVGILLLGQAAFGIYPIAANYLVLTAGLTRLSAFASFSGATVVLGAVVASGSTYGALGAACATAIGYLTMAAVALALTRIAGLTIHWRLWLSCWPETTVAATSLLLGVGALFCPIGSGARYTLIAMCVVTLASLYPLLTANRREKRNPIHDQPDADFS
jgi:O-antigen/teichoic acid export membrane protein